MTTTGEESIIPTRTPRHIAEMPSSSRLASYYNEDYEEHDDGEEQSEEINGNAQHKVEMKKSFNNVVENKQASDSRVLSSSSRHVM